MMMMIPIEWMFLKILLLIAKILATPPDKRQVFPGAVRDLELELERRHELDK